MPPGNPFVQQKIMQSIEQALAAKGINESRGEPGYHRRVLRRRKCQLADRLSELVKRDGIRIIHGNRG